VGSPQARIVVSAALQLFRAQDPVDVVLALTGTDEPDEADGARVTELCLSAAADPTDLPEILLVGASEGAARSCTARVRTTDDAAAARAVVLLAAAARGLYADQEQAAQASAQATAAVRASTPTSDARLVRLQEQLAVARRDVGAAVAVATGRRRPLVVLVFQHRGYWGAVATLVEAMRARTDVDFEVVAVDSAADGRRESTLDFLAGNGVEARTPAWFSAHRDAVDVVVLDNPYDEMRPADLTVPALTAAGIRLVAVPYGSNAISGAFMDKLLWDLPLQRSAWRAYLPSHEQARLFGVHCATGGDCVRVLGSPKLDRIVRPVQSERAASIRRLAAGRPVFLWNPHFRVGPGGWSTFETYLDPLVDRFSRDSRAVLVVRPHFRLFPDLRRLGGGALERRLRQAVSASRNLVLDEQPDYLDALSACDAMLSDLSSLATELLPSGKPVLYLHRADGPGPNSEGSYFSAMYRADGWPDVEQFLDMVVRGEDPQREQRLAEMHAALPYTDGGAGARVADDLVGSLLDDLQLDRASAQPDGVRADETGVDCRAKGSAPCPVQP
jgi:hypothetical protein